MTQYGICTQCQSPIPSERLLDQTVVCPACGGTDKSLETKEQLKLSRQLSTFYVVFSVLFLASTIHLLHWDKFSVEVIQLKTQSVLGLSSPSQHLRMADICSARHHHDCTENSLRKLLMSPEHKLDALARLADLQRKRGQDAEAINSYSEYFHNGGQDLEAAYHYARLMGQYGQVEGAKVYFERILESRSDMLQISVTRAYVQLLVDNGELKAAKLLIEGIRKQGGNAGSFMQTEFEEINRALRLAQG